MATIISPEETEVYLGRPLASAETDNFDALMEIAQTRLLGLLCLTEWPEEVESGLKLLVAQMFGVVVKDLKSTTDSGVTSKKVEDFSVNYGSNPDSPEVIFEKTFAREIANYSKCAKGIRSGRIRSGDCFRCI